MKIIRAKYSGFCSGVDRAYKTALEIAAKKLPVYILGFLVHNHQVIEKLGSLGIKSVDSIAEIPSDSQGYLIISAHGAGPAVHEEASKTGLEVIDTTCPWVKKPQRLARQLSDEGFRVIIVGDKNHTEVKGLMGWAGRDAIVVEKPGDVEPLMKMEKAGVIAQTTQSQENFTSVVEKLRQKVNDLKVYNTICNATSHMQDSAVEVAQKVGLMLVIGDKKSANTKRLRELCSLVCPKTYQIQSADELREEWLYKQNIVGISAGASTPDWVIEEVVNKIGA